MNNQIKALIIDFDKSTHNYISTSLKKIKWLKIIARCYNSIDGIEKAKKLKPDIVFLEIEMPNISGLEIVDLLQSYNFYFIVLTSNRSFAFECYFRDIPSFLIKPIDYNLYIKALNKFSVCYINKENKIQYDFLFSDLSSFNLGTTLFEQQGQIDSNNLSKIDYLWVRANRTDVKIYYCDISYIQGMKDYVKIFVGNTYFMTHGSLSVISKKLPKNIFYRIHKSYIVNVSYIKAIEKKVIILVDDEKISISCDKRKSLLSFVNFNVRNTNRNE